MLVPAAAALSGRWADVTKTTFLALRRKKL
jgi:hypothetical protein